MKRREAFKKMGIFTLIGASGMAFLQACKNEGTAEVAATAALEAKVAPPVKTEREKLIINRQHYGYADPAKPTPDELKHTPDIILGEKDEQGHTLVKVTVGKEGIIHPSIPEHWIDYIRIYQNDKLVAETEFANGGIRGFSHHYIMLAPGDKITAEAGCNLHGIYESSLSV